GASVWDAARSCCRRNKANTKQCWRRILQPSGGYDRSGIAPFKCSFSKPYDGNGKKRYFWETEIH
ncbi:unnamed protein product, partial [Heterosigma akashiwo]